MASWKKIAEAFGVAMHNPKVSEEKFNRFARSAEKSPETEKAFIKGLDEGEDADYRIIGVDDQDPNADDKLERAFDAEVDAMTDRNLQDDFDKGFEAALAKRRGKIRDAMGDAIESNEIPDEARRIWDNYDFDFERSYGPRDAYERAVKLARTSEDEYLPASAEEFEERYGFAVDGEIPDRNNAIQHQFGNAINARDADEAADAGINDIRKAAIEMLKSGQDIGDVLRILKGE